MKRQSMNWQIKYLKAITYKDDIRFPPHSDIKYRTLSSAETVIRELKTRLEVVTELDENTTTYNDCVIEDVKIQKGDNRKFNNCIFYTCLFNNDFTDTNKFTNCVAVECFVTACNGHIGEGAILFVVADSADDVLSHAVNFTSVERFKLDIRSLYYTESRITNIRRYGNSADQDYITFLDNYNLEKEDGNTLFTDEVGLFLECTIDLTNDYIIPLVQENSVFVNCNIKGGDNVLLSNCTLYNTTVDENIILRNCEIVEK